MNPRYLFTLLLLFALTIVVHDAYSQRGKIIRSATTNVLDPNGDGFVSKTNSGFSSDGYYVDEFEYRMFPIPKLSGDVTGDNIGQICGITDLIPDSKGMAVYALRDGGNNLIFRFRVGDDNPSVEAWTILLDTDGKMGVGTDPNANAGNPGFEIDITLIKRNNSGVLVYNIDGNDNCPSSQLFYGIDSHFQISIADEVSCGDPDYFYDFYVPFSEIASTFNITANTGLRYVAVTNVSATCAMEGNISDIAGIDDNDPEYSACESCAFEDLINAQCPTAIVDLCETCEGFEKDKVSAPIINEPIRAGQTQLTGSSIESNIYIRVQVFTNTAPAGSTPTWGTVPRVQVGVNTVGTSWTVNLESPLLAYDKIVATALKDEFSVPCAADGNPTSSTSVTVVAPNTRPVATNQTVNVVEDMQATITLTATDPENDPLVYTVVTLPSHGTLSGSPPNLIYTPALNYFGSDSFTFQVSDGIFNSLLPGTVTINVTPVNDKPVANNLNVSTTEDTPVATTLSASDVDGDALAYTIVTPPTNGTLSGTAPNLTYTPAANYFGQDTYTYKVNDGTEDSNTATVSVNVTPVAGDAPVANPQNVSTLEDTPVAITLTGSDPDFDPITYIIVSGPTNGVLTGSAPNVTYRPNTNYNGPDSFTFRVNDGTLNSPVVTVNITVVPVDDNPVANNQSVTTLEDTPVAFTLSVTNPDNDPLTFTILTVPTHGVLSGTAPNLTYTPNLNYFGSDSFTFRVNNGSVDSNVATVSINVLSVGGDAPVANALSVTTPEDTPVSITLTGSDPDLDPITYVVVSAPTNGTLSGTGANRTYTPNTNYNGADSFTFRVNDGTLNSPTVTVSITVTPVDDNPVANNQSVTTPEDTPVAFTLSVTNPDNDPLTYTILTVPTHGVLSGTAPNLTYTPNANYFGSDSFTYRVNNGVVDSNTATVSINVTAVAGDAPVSNAQIVTTAEDTPVGITLTGSDPDLDPITYVIVTLPSNGTLSGTGANRTYTPNLNYNGADSFTFRVNDGALNSPVATVNITVTPVDDTPVANNQSITTPEDTPVAFVLSATNPDNDPLTYTIISVPTNGVLSGSAPNLTYTPDANYFGSDSFTFRVNNGSVDSNTASVSITVTPVSGDAPVANAQSVTTPEDTPVAITLTGSDPDLDPLTYNIISNPTNGVLTGTAPNVTYRPNTNFNGSDSFTFRVNDGTFNSPTVTVDITVTPVNDVPVALNQSVTYDLDTPKPITLTGSDADGDPLTFSITVQPTNGVLSGSGANVTYTPNNGFTGSDSFKFTVNDGTATSTLATVSLNLTPVAPVAPVADNQTITTPEETPVLIVLTASDENGDNLTFTISQAPTNGTLNVSGANVIYTPNTDYGGADSFKFEASDGVLTSNEATVSITVTPVNDAPVANSQSVSTNEDTPKAIVLTGSDVEGSALTYEILTNPSNGSLAVAGANVTYTPAQDFNGSDNFSFRVNDGSLNSAPATVSITVNPVNDAPVATNQAITTLEDTPVGITLMASDVDNAFTFAITQNPANGVLTVNGSSVVYTPNANYNGADSFKFEANDGSLTSNEATVSITVTPVNDAPLADDQSVSTNEDTPKAIVLAGSDGESNAITYVIVVNPSQGTLAVAGANVTYTPAANYNGSDSFTYLVNDGIVNSSTATVSITVNAVNDAPVADAQNVTTPEDTPVGITLTATDVDNAVTFSITQNPANGVLTVSGSNVIYTPNADYNGNDSFKFEATDGTLTSNEATVSITVTPVNDTPVANSQSVSTNEDTPMAITLTGADAEGGVLTYEILTNPANGTLSVSGANVTYTPAPDYNGADGFTFRANDGVHNSSGATVSITVNPVNDAPVASGQSLTTPEDTPLAITIVATDVDNAVTYSITQSPVNGTLSIVDADVTYSPDANYNGPDSYKFTASDGTLTSNEAVVAITVTPVNDPPIANAQSVSTNEDTPKTITLTGSDIEGSPLTYAIATTPSHGTVSLTGASATYTPSLTYSGPDNFTFVVNDSELNSSPATVSISVISLGSAPVAVDKYVSTNEEVAVDADLAPLVSDSDGNALIFSIVDQPTHGTFAINGTLITYTPAANYNGADTIAFLANDGTHDSNIGHLYITVLPVNDDPVANSQTVTTNEDVTADIVLTASDADGSLFNYTLLTAPANGTLTGTAPALNYEPDKDFNGTDSFTFKVNDGFIDSNVGTVTIQVLPVNDAPHIRELTSLVPTKEDSLLRVCLNVVDVDGDEVIYSNPVNIDGGGTMVRDVAPFDFCYIFTPELNYNGGSLWNLLVTDDNGLTGETPADILIKPVNDAPVAFDEFATITADSTLVYNLVENDLPIEGPFNEFYDIYAADSIDVVSLVNIVTQPLYGNVSVNIDNGTIQYKPQSFTFIGSDSVTYQVCDSGHPRLCTTATLFIEITDNQFPFKIYEGISPNNDGLNDYMHIDGIHRYPDNQVRIFDRYNNLVFEISDYDNESRRWEGQSNHGMGKGSLPEGTYYYTVYLEEEDGKMFSGYVLLKEK